MSCLRTNFSSSILRHNPSRRSAILPSAAKRALPARPAFLFSIHTIHTSSFKPLNHQDTSNSMSGPGASNDALLASNLFSVEGLVCLVTGVGGQQSSKFTKSTTYTSAPGSYRHWPHVRASSLHKRCKGIHHWPKGRGTGKSSQTLQARWKGRAHSVSDPLCILLYSFPP